MGAMALQRFSFYYFYVIDMDRDVKNCDAHMISFQIVFVWAFKIVVDSGKFGMLLLYIL